MILVRMSCSSLLLLRSLFFFREKDFLLQSHETFAAQRNVWASSIHWAHKQRLFWSPSPVATPMTGGPQSAPPPASPIPKNTNVEWRTPWPLSATSPAQPTSIILTSSSASAAPPPPAPVLSASPPGAPALPVTNYLCSLLSSPHPTVSSLHTDHSPISVVISCRGLRAIQQ
jgi:hypothetical protein